MRPIVTDVAWSVCLLVTTMIFLTLFGRWQQRCGLSLPVLQQLVGGKCCLTPVDFTHCRQCIYRPTRLAALRYAAQNAILPTMIVFTCLPVRLIHVGVSIISLPRANKLWALSKAGVGVCLTVLSSVCLSVCLSVSKTVRFKTSCYRTSTPFKKQPVSEIRRSRGLKFSRPKTERE